MKGVASSFPAGFRAHWPIYCMEAIELAVFMLSACGFSILLFHPDSAVVKHLPSPAIRRALLGVAMGATAAGIMQSPLGKRSGAHFNPAVTLAFLWLGKITSTDATFYVVAQFLGGCAGVLLSSVLFGHALADPSVAYAVTVPGKYGNASAFFAEVFMAFLLIAVILRVMNHRLLHSYTPLFAGVLIALYVFLFAPVSGFSINPARTVGSAVVASVWTAVWIYFCAPILGMILAAEQYIRVRGVDAVFCAKLQHNTSSRCHFRCQFAVLLAQEKTA